MAIAWKLSDEIKPDTLASILKQAGAGEKAEDSHSASVPDLPGRVEAGTTISDVEREMCEAIRFHLDGPREDGPPVPASTCAVAH